MSGLFHRKYLSDTSLDEDMDSSNGVERRKILAIIGGASSATLTGCLNGGTGEEDDDPPENGDGETPENGDETRMTDEELKELTERVREGSVVEFGGMVVSTFPTFFRSDARASTTAGVIEPATDDSPAVLMTAVRNENDYDHRFQTRNIPPYDRRPIGRPDDRENDPLYLVPTENHEFAEQSPDVTRYGVRWRLDGSIDNWLPETVEIGAEDVVYGEYFIVAHPDRAREPISSGSYRFSGGDRPLEISVWESGEPGPPEDSVFEGVDVPDPLEERESDRETSWYHEADETTEVYLKPSREEVEPPVEAEYEMINRSREPVSGNPDGWGLYKLVDGDWFHVAPDEVQLPATSIPPGGTAESSLTVYHRGGTRGGGRTVWNVGGGRYAYLVHFGKSGYRNAALLDIDAPELRLEPPEDAQVDDRGDVIEVSSGEWRERQGRTADERMMRPIRVEIVEDEDGERIITEQTYKRRNEYMRYSLPFFEEGVEEVVAKADAGGMRSAFMDEGTTYVYEGTVYRFRYEGE